LIVPFVDCLVSIFFTLKNNLLLIVHIIKYPEKKLTMNEVLHAYWYYLMFNELVFYYIC